MQPLQWVRSFEATARHGNFTRAAQELGLTQAAVSQHVKALETRLRVQLFERGARGVALTGAGSELYTSVAEGIGRIEAALGRFGVTDEHRLHVLSNASLSSGWLTTALPGFLFQHPDLDLRLSTALWQTDAIGVRADISLFLGPMTQPGAVAIPGGDMVVVGPMEGGNTETLIRLTGFEDSFEAFRRSHHQDVQGRLRSIECDSFQAALTMAQSGVGVTFAPRLLAVAAIRNGQLRDMGPCTFHPPTGYWSRIANAHSQAAHDFQDWVRDAAQRWLTDSD